MSPARRGAARARAVRGRLSPRVVGQGALRCSAPGARAPRPPPRGSLLCANGPPPLPYSAVVDEQRRRRWEQLLL